MMHDIDEINNRIEELESELDAFSKKRDLGLESDLLAGLVLKGKNKKYDFKIDESINLDFLFKNNISSMSDITEEIIFAFDNKDKFYLDNAENTENFNSSFYVSSLPLLMKPMNFPIFSNFYNFIRDLNINNSKTDYIHNFLGEEFIDHILDNKFSEYFSLKKSIVRVSDFVSGFLNKDVRENVVLDWKKNEINTAISSYEEEFKLNLEKKYIK
jgi:hypothetical protein